MTLLWFSLALAAPDPQAGALVYARYCAQCHGDSGQADGPAAPWVYPRPRVLADNFSYKLRSTPSGELPTAADLARVVRRGVPGSAMPPFDLLSDTQTDDVVAYVMSLCPDFADPDLTAPAVPLPALDQPEPPADADAVARGAQLYRDKECFKCHGQAGLGDGPSWATLSDDWGDPILPADLSAPQRFRGGDLPADIRRAMLTGLNGTPMPSYLDSLQGDESWELAHYVASLALPEPDSDDVLRLIRLDTLPTSADDPAWEALPLTALRTLPNLLQAPRSGWSSVHEVRLQGAWNAQGVALRLRWHDRSHSTHFPDTDAPRLPGQGPAPTDIVRGAPYPDRLFLQRAPGPGPRPPLSFGDRTQPVLLWRWSADSDSLDAAVAHGFARQSGTSPLSGGAIYADGAYSLLLRAPLDDSLSPGVYLPLALSVWDGDAGETGLRRGLTGWHWMVLEAGVPLRAWVFGGLASLLTLLALLWGLRLARHTGAPR